MNIPRLAVLKQWLDEHLSGILHQVGIILAGLYEPLLHGSLGFYVETKLTFQNLALGDMVGECTGRLNNTENQY